jgi:hypothetical protein
MTLRLPRPHANARAEDVNMADRTLTDAELAELDRLDTVAPAGPWTVEHYTDGGVETYAVESDASPICVLTEDLTGDLEDEPRRTIEVALAFVAVARTAMPLLVAEVRRLCAADHPVIVDSAARV